ELRLDDPREIVRNDPEAQQTSEACAGRGVITNAERTLSAVPQRLRIVRLFGEHLLDQVADRTDDRRLILEHISFRERALPIVVGGIGPAPRFLDREPRARIIAQGDVAAAEETPARNVVGILGHAPRELRDEGGFVRLTGEKLRLP